MRGRLALLVVSMLVLVGIAASIGFADPNLGDVRAHRHYIQLKPGDPTSEWVAVGRIFATTRRTLAFRRRSTSSTTTFTWAAARWRRPGTRPA